MFDCCRIPGSEGLDWSKSFAVAGDSGDSGDADVELSCMSQKEGRGAGTGMMLDDGVGEIENGGQHQVGQRDATSRSSDLGGVRVNVEKTSM